MGHPEYVSLANLYAMGAMDGADRARFEKHLAACADCRTAVRELREASSDLALAPPATAAPRAKPPRRPWALAAVAAALILAGVAFMTLRSAGRTYALAGESGASGHVASTGRRGRFEARALPPLAPGKVWQLWHLVPGAPPTAAGRYAPDPSGRVAGGFELSTPAGPGHGFALTMEPAGGSKDPSPPRYLEPAGK
ncbi:MAG TPA: anti-sigma factor [Planctomycetota bacterium]